MLTRVTLAHEIRGGMEIHAETLRRGLTAKGHRVTTITTVRADGVALTQDEWGVTHFVGGGSPGIYNAQWWQRSLDTLLALHRSDPFDAIGGHGKAAYGYLGAKSRLSPADQIPTVVITHQNIINDFTALLQQLPRQTPRLVKWLPNAIALYADDRRKLPLASVITTPNSLSEHALTRWFPIRPDAIEVIRNSVHVGTFTQAGSERVATRAQMGLSDDTRLILALGRFERRKGQRYLLEALLRPELQPYFSEVTVALAGDGRTRLQLEVWARQRSLSNVRFLGSVPHSDVPALLSAADIVVYPTLSEGQSLALLEGMAARRPIIATEIDANRDVLANESALLVKPASAEALAHALATLLADPLCADTLARQAYARAQALYDEPLMIAGYERAFCRAANT
jgi:glycosyltransferase involved in cell wall biosynthesis